MCARARYVLMRCKAEVCMSFLKDTTNKAAPHRVLLAKMYKSLRRLLSGCWLFKHLQSCCGQGSLEYVLVTVAFLSMILALSALWHAWAKQDLLQRSIDASSHTTAQGVIGDVQDILLY